MKELTQSEIEKTEHLSKACSLLVANQTDIDRKLNFGVTTSKRNVTTSMPRSKPGNESMSSEKSNGALSTQNSLSRSQHFD